MSNVEIFLSLFVVFAWVGAIWYVKSFSKKVKALDLDNSNQKIDKLLHQFRTDPMYNSLSCNIYHNDND